MVPSASRGVLDCPSSPSRARKRLFRALAALLGETCLEGTSTTPTQPSFRKAAQVAASLISPAVPHGLRNVPVWPLPLQFSSLERTASQATTGRNHWLVRTFAQSQSEHSSKERMDMADGTSTHPVANSGILRCLEAATQFGHGCRTRRCVERAQQVPIDLQTSWEARRGDSPFLGFTVRSNSPEVCGDTLGQLALTTLRSAVECPMGFQECTRSEPVK